ncbi:MAG TPA: S41 family peptidase [Ktedonobacteraceae bacterium]|nr:S41 family peptidase [Ktedonobacteraceae bacterium]
MRYVRFLLLVLIVAGVLSSCGQAVTAPTLTPTPILSSQARIYLTAALDIMQQHSVNRKKINWTMVRQQTFAFAFGAKTRADTYSAIRYALTALGDHHSVFLDPQQLHQIEAAPITSDQEPHGKLLAQGIGYLELPSIVKLPWSEEAKRYVTLAQDAIRISDQAGTCGWIVDLRNDPGGDIWPMLDGVGPILGDGIVGSIVGPDGFKQSWGYFNGQALVGGSTIIVADNPYHLKHALPPVAVLTGPETASAGEAIVVAFRGRPSTRSFGEPTAGVPTANQDFTLSDGALLVLTVALDADRTGRTYDSAIPPDQLVPFAASQIGTPGDPGVQAATTWLHKQEGC